MSPNMDKIYKIDDSLKNCCLSIGNFDGVHRGHQALIAQARALAEERKSALAVLAFEPHPAEFFHPRPDSIRLTPLRAKARLLAELGVNAMFALTFDESMAKRSAPDFVCDVLVKGLGLSGAVVGPDAVVCGGGRVAAGAVISRCVVWPGATASGKQSGVVIMPNVAIPAEA